MSDNQNRYSMVDCDLTSNYVQQQLLPDLPLFQTPNITRYVSPSTPDDQSIYSQCLRRPSAFGKRRNRPFSIAGAEDLQNQVFNIYGNGFYPQALSQYFTPYQSVYYSPVRSQRVLDSTTSEENKEESESSQFSKVTDSLTDLPFSSDNPKSSSSSPRQKFKISSSSSSSLSKSGRLSLSQRIRPPTPHRIQSESEKDSSSGPNNRVYNDQEVVMRRKSNRRKANKFRRRSLEIQSLRKDEDEEEEEKPKSDSELTFDKLIENLSHKKSLELGTLVELRRNGISFFGAVRWSGWLAHFDAKAVGVEMEEDVTGASNGWHLGTQLFVCPQGRGVFVPFTHVGLDRRRGPEGLAAFEFGGLECPIVTGTIKPIDVNMEETIKKISGRNKGIQGHQNSCYLDATLFAMFAFTSAFDTLLYRPANDDDIAQYCEVQRTLRDEIVNPLRRNVFVRADRVMRLRKLLDQLSSVQGLLSDEKDPEEFLHSLLTQTLKSSPYLHLSSGQTSHLYQLFVEKDDSLTLPNVQQLLEQSFLTSSIKLQTVPNVLVLQLPRFGRQFKLYDRILPSPYLDVTDIIDNSPRQCIICGKLATIECLDCYGDHSSGLDSTAFCPDCLRPVHNHKKRKNHRPTQIQLSQEYINSSSVPRLQMELFAVVCIETSHYVSFVKCGSGSAAEWCFFDSMADRKGDVNGFNIPEVVPAPEITKLFKEENLAFLEANPDAKSLPNYVKRLLCDGYMCFYQSTEVMMYQ